jgi:hypothetical protein
VLFPFLFFFQLFQMLVVDVISFGHELFVPSIIAGFIPADQQDRCSARIERIKGPVRAPLMLDAKLAHMIMPRCFDSGGMGHLQSRPGFGKQGDGKVDALLLCSVETVPPLTEFVRKFDFPSHLL